MTYLRSRLVSAWLMAAAEILTFLSYTMERKLAGKPEEFGKGAIKGVAGPEAANNASAAGTLVPLVPLLTLGLPGSATMIAIAALALIAPFAFKGLAKFRQDED